MSRLEQLRKLAEIEPDDPMSHYGVGLECVNREMWIDAIGAFERALRADAGYCAAYYHKARAELAAERSDDARRTLDTGMRCAADVADEKTLAEMRELLESIA